MSLTYNLKASTKILHFLRRGVAALDRVDVPENAQHVWFQHDGAPAQFSRRACSQIIEINFFKHCRILIPIHNKSWENYEVAHIQNKLRDRTEFFPYNAGCQRMLFSNLTFWSARPLWTRFTWEIVSRKANGNARGRSSQAYCRAGRSLFQARILQEKDSSVH